MVELKTFLIAMVPVIELRGSIPIALEVYHMPLWSAYFFSVLGNLGALCLIVILGSICTAFLVKRGGLLARTWTWVLEHTKKAHEPKAVQWGKGLAVLLLVATPIPFVGGWTGAFLALVLGMSLLQAFPFLLAGSLLAGIFVSILTVGITSIL